MIEEVHGNLLSAETEALVNTVNTVGVMGKGIALQFKRAFPANYRAYRAACARGEVQLGAVWAFDTGTLGVRRFILNFPTKGHWRSASQMSDIEAGLDSLVRVVGELGIRSIAIPALGCGNGGLEWAQVRPLIVDAVARMGDIEAVVFPPEGAPEAASMPNRTARPPLTRFRALLLVAIHRYVGRARLQEMRDGVSELEIQKLAYFLQALGAPLGLTFVRGSYGPYSQTLSNALNSLEGHHLTGLGDRTAKVMDLVPVTPQPESVAEAAGVVEEHPGDLRLLDELLALVDGFETPYSLELLATVHFAAGHEPPTSDPGDLSARVASWSLRKARMFTPRHVEVATARLVERRLIGG